MSLIVRQRDQTSVSWAWVGAHFPGRRRVTLAVVPTTDEPAALPAVAAARQAGADGVFLVNAGIGHQTLLRIAGAVARRYEPFFVGVNCRDLRTQDVFCRLPQGVRGVWSQTAGLLPPEPSTVAAIAEAHHATGWPGLLFAQIEPVEFDDGTDSDTRARRSRLSRALTALERIPTVITIACEDGYAAAAPPILARLRQPIGDWPLAIVVPRGSTASSEPPSAVTFLLERRL